MIIHPIKKETAAGRVRVSAFFEFESRPDLSDTLWFELPAEQAGDLSAQSNAFATAAVVPAMALGEDLFVRGQMSPRLLANLRRYQDKFIGWYPRVFKPVKVLAETAAVEIIDRSRQVAACPFSGGVDSFYTLLQHAASGRGPEDAVGLVLLIHGFDIPLRDIRTFDAARSAYREFAVSQGLELVDIATNVRETKFSRITSWIMTGGGILSAVAQLLSPRISKYYIAAAQTLATDFPCSTHPLLDPLLSLENLEVAHDHPISRVIKTGAVAQYPASYRYLRVCWENKDGINNCCRCQKCVRTMLTLELFGALDRYKTFPLPLPEGIRNWALYGDEAIGFAEQILDEARARGRSVMAGEIVLAIERSRSTLRLVRVTAKLLGLDLRRTESLNHHFFQLHRLAGWIDHRLRRLWCLARHGPGSGHKAYPDVREPQGGA